MSYASVSESSASQPRRQAEEHAKQIQDDRLLRALLQPIPLSRVRNTGMNHVLLQLGDLGFISPERTLQSVMRTLFLLKQVSGGFPGLDLTGVTQRNCV